MEHDINSNKVSSQLGHFIFRSLPSSSPSSAATPPSSASSTSSPCPHKNCLGLLNKMIEIRVTVNTSLLAQSFICQFAFPFLILNLNIKSLGFSTIFNEIFYLHHLAFAFFAALLSENRDFGSILKNPNNGVTSITHQLPFGNASWVKHQDASITVHTLANTKTVETMATGWMGAVGTVAASLHAREWYVAEAVGTEYEGLPLGSSAKVDQLKIIQRTFQLLMQFQRSILLRHIVSFITSGTKQSLWLSFY